LASLFAALLLSLPPLAAQEEGEPVPASDQKIDIPVPVGEDVVGIKIPFYGEDGALQMTFEADLARKLDENRVEMDGLSIEVFDEDNDKMNIALPKSTLDMEERMLRGDDGVVIKREDFQLEGDTVIFNIQKRSGVIGGEIRMLIYSLDPISE